MAVCEEACCGTAFRRTVSDLFDRGYPRNRAATLPVEGSERIDANGLAARFSLDIAHGRIRAASFRATTCVTLIAYCELIAEIVPGQDIREAATLSETGLLAALPDVPLPKRNRAALAINAFRAAIQAAAPHLQTGEAI